MSMQWGFSSFQVRQLFGSVHLHYYCLHLSETIRSSYHYHSIYWVLVVNAILQWFLVGLCCHSLEWKAIWSLIHCMTLELLSMSSRFKTTFLMLFITTVAVSTYKLYQILPGTLVVTSIHRHFPGRHQVLHPKHCSGRTGGSLNASSTSKPLLDGCTLTRKHWPDRNVSFHPGWRAQVRAPCSMELHLHCSTCKTFPEVGREGKCLYDLLCLISRV